jgi:hypothetical protein
MFSSFFFARGGAAIYPEGRRIRTRISHTHTHTHTAYPSIRAAAGQGWRPAALPSCSAHATCSGHDGGGGGVGRPPSFLPPTAHGLLGPRATIRVGARTRRFAVVRRGFALQLLPCPSWPHGPSSGPARAPARQSRPTGCGPCAGGSSAPSLSPSRLRVTPAPARRPARWKRCRRTPPRACPQRCRRTPPRACAANLRLKHTSSLNTHMMKVCCQAHSV